MANSNYAEPVVMLRGHLEEIQESLDAARGYFVSRDLAKQYENIGGTSRQSNLSKRVEKALERVEGYLVIEPEPDDVS